MKAYLYLSFTLFFANSVMSQATWLTPIYRDSQVHMVESDQQLDWISEGDTHWINYNPVFPMDDAFFLDVSKSESSGLSLFAVYQPDVASQEQHVLSVFSSDKNIAVLTDRRLADFHRARFANFLDHDPREIKLTSFTSSTIAEQDLRIKLAGQAQKADLPVMKASGYIGDIITFPKAVSPMTKEIIESILSLKYGIPLSPLAKYRDVKGDILLDLATTEYGHQVGGIGAVGSMHFQQKQSKSTVEKGTLSIALNSLHENNVLNPATPEENGFLLWSDDHRSLIFRTQSTGNLLIDRTWEIVNHGISNDPYFQVFFNESLLTDQLEEDEQLWIEIESERKSTFHPLDERGMSEAVRIDNGIHRMRVYRAPIAWIAVNTQGTECTHNRLGSAQIRLVGSYDEPTVIVRDDDHQVIYEEQGVSGAISLVDLVSGRYIVDVYEKGTLIVTHQFFINDDQFDELKIPSEIHIDRTKDAFFDASHLSTQDYNYEWIDPEGDKVKRAEIQFTKQGIYKLIVSNGSCTATYYIAVMFSAESFKSFDIYPNPSSTGNVWWEIEQVTERPIHITISDILGNQLSSQNLATSVFHRGHFYYPHNGTLLLTARSGSTVQTKKVIIQNLY